MKTVGETLKDARSKKRYSVERVEKDTKIKKNFIVAIEKGNWEALPEFPVVLGFVKNIASYLGFDPKNAIALLRRDYPPKVLAVNPKPDVAKGFSWSPKMTFLVGVGATVLLIAGYLSYQYINFISPPPLTVENPKEGQEVTKNEVEVSGKTNPDATVKVNNQPVLVDEDGSFSINLEISEKTNQLDVVATSRAGKMSEVKVGIVPNF
jgi:cytoskeletal protein RodZ